MKVDDTFVFGKLTCDQEVEIAHRLTDLLSNPPGKIVHPTNTEWLAWSHPYEEPAIHNEVRYYSNYCTLGNPVSDAAAMALLLERGKQEQYQKTVKARVLDESLFRTLIALDLADPVKTVSEYEKLVESMEKVVVDYRERSYVPNGFIHPF